VYHPAPEEKPEQKQVHRRDRKTGASKYVGYSYLEYFGRK